MSGERLLDLEVIGRQVRHKLSQWSVPMMFDGEKNHMTDYLQATVGWSNRGKIKRSATTKGTRSSISFKSGLFCRAE